MLPTAILTIFGLILSIGLMTPLITDNEFFLTNYQINV